MRTASPDIAAALRRLLVGLERPAQLDEWCRRGRLAEAVVAPLAVLPDLPKAA